MITDKKMKDFREECDQWMESLDYDIHSISTNDDKLDLMYMAKNLDQGNPAITCIMKTNGQKRCQLHSAGSFKLFITMQSGEMQFKHPNIEEWIHAMRHYNLLAEMHPPNLPMIRAEIDKLKKRGDERDVERFLRDD